MGFLDKKYKTKIKTKKVNIDLAKRFGCKLCPLAKNKVDMKPTGSDNPLIYVLGEAPGRDEVLANRQFVGKSGKFLRRYLSKYFNIEDVRFNNCVRCRPPNNRDPLEIELECCRESVENDIAKTKPKYILGFGKVAFNSTFNKTDKITLWRGRQIPIRIKNHVCWYLPFYHPGRIIRKNKKGFDAEEHCFNLDLKKASKFIKQDLIPSYVEENDLFENVVILQTIDEIKSALENLGEIISIDIETKKKRPYFEGAKILSWAVSDGNVTYAFCADGLEDDFIKDFLLDSRIKIVQNLGFELEWFAYFYGREVIWETEWHDTMRLGYVLDERKIGKGGIDKGEGRGALSLDDQTFINYGFELKKYSTIDYSDVEGTPILDLLNGNGLDAKWTYNLFEKQYEIVANNKKLNKIYQGHIETAKSCVGAQLEGVIIDKDQLEHCEKMYKDKFKETKNAIAEFPESKKFSKRYRRDFRPGADNDLPLMFFDILGLDKVESDNVRGWTLDKNALKLYADEGNKVASYIVDYRRYRNLISQYGMKGLGKLISPDGKLHANFNDAFTSTGRLCSNNINLQNWDNRSDSRVIRSIIVPPEDHYIVCIDYAQIEAIGIAVSAKDKNFCEMIRNNYDVHMAWTKRIIKDYPKAVSHLKHLSEEEMLKTYRSVVKNKMVFPAFYGAVVESIADYLGIPLLIAKSIMSDFWRTFRDAKKWQEGLFRFYKRYGYVESIFGRIHRAPLRYNQIANYPIQGLAADIVKRAMNALSFAAYKYGKPQYQFVLNIHDDLSFYLPMKTFEEDLLFICKEMVRLPKKFLEIDVPLTVEVEVGTNWANTKKFEKYKSTDFNY